jgi:hypothetical protein
LTIKTNEQEKKNMVLGSLALCSWLKSLWGFSIDLHGTEEGIESLYLTLAVLPVGLVSVTTDCYEQG